MGTSTTEMTRIALCSKCSAAVELKYIEDIQMFLLNMAFTSSSEVENIYIS